MKIIVKKGRTSLLVRVFLQDSSSTTGAGLTGLTSGSAGLVCYRARDDDGNAAATQLTLSAGTRGTWSSGGFVEKDSTNMPGIYELGLPDAGQATGSETVTYMIKGATNLAPLALEIQLVAYDPQNANLGLSNVSANVAQWNGTNVSAPATAGIPDVNVKNINNVAAATPGASGGILISGSNSGTTTLGALTVTGATTMTGGLAVSAGATITGSATGVGLTISGGGTSGAGLVINTTSGDAVQVSPTAGHGINIAANGTSKHGITSTGGTAGTSDGIKAVAGTGGVDIRGNITGNVTGNLSGSAGSVTGAVGSVTAGVTVTTNNDKTGYSLTQAFPSNFSSLGITAGGHISNVDTLTTYTGNTVQTGDSFARLGAPAGASVSADIAEIEGETDTLLAGVIVTTNNDKTGYSLTQAFPTNFSALAITAGGAVTVGTNNDKTGYSLSQAFPANFSSLAITGGGAVTTGTNNDKTGYSITGNVTVGGYAAGQDPMTLAFQTALTESYAALHTAPTATQLLFSLRGHMAEKSIAGTTLTLKRVDGATTAETYTLNDAVSPTSITRAS